MLTYSPVCFSIFLCCWAVHGSRYPQICWVLGGFWLVIPFLSAFFPPRLKEGRSSRRLCSVSGLILIDLSSCGDSFIDFSFFFHRDCTLAKAPKGPPQSLLLSAFDP